MATHYAVPGTFLYTVVMRVVRKHNDGLLEYLPNRSYGNQMPHTRDSLEKLAERALAGTLSAKDINEIVHVHHLTA